MRIANNIQSLNVLNREKINRKNSSKAIEKLSSGLRINKAADDAAGLAISQKMRAQIRGLNQASRNAQDGISLIQTAEGALGEMGEITQRIRELCVQGANGTLMDDDRDKIQSELDSLKSEMHNIASTTEFNTRKLLDGSAKGVSSESTSSSPVNLNFGEAIWRTNIGGSNGDNVNGVIASNDGGTIAFGTTSSADGDIPTIYGSNDAFVTKLDSDGNKVWTKNYGGSGHDTFNSSIAVSDGYILVGGTYSSNQDVSSNNGDSDVWAVKIDNSGNIVWEETYGGADGDWGNKIIESTPGNYLIVGAKSSAPFWDSPSILEIDSNGALGLNLWNGDTSLEINDVVKNVDGSYTVLGQDLTGVNGGSDVLLWKLDIGLNTVWQKNLGGSNSEPINLNNTQLLNTSDGGYIFTVDTTSTDGDVSDVPNGNQDVWLVKTDVDGNKEWDVLIGGSQGDVPLGGIKEVDDGYVLLLDSDSNDGDFPANNGNTDLALVKVDTSGVIQNITSFGGSGQEVSRSSYVNSDGDLIIAFETQSLDGDAPTINGGIDVWISKVNVKTTNVQDETSQSGGITLQIGANTGQTMTISIDDMRPEALGYVDDMPRVNPIEMAGVSLTLTDQVLNRISSQRSKFGAQQNALEHVIRNVNNASEQLSAAESRIADVDMAKEMMSLSKFKILEEAVNAMMAQSNQLPQGILQLLK
ncbi:MAG: hypothetical protein JEZ08_03370 [Clostridiales bacterium]|nr:hypothetical protein [Clostridiales bacterium]